MNVLDLLGVLVINLDVELAFEIKEDVESIQRVDPKGLETAVRLNAFERNAF